jgi:Holliday junction resolvasome RuvABC DNA-binding subunit
LPDLEIVGADQSASLDARSALENLGYSPGEVRAALGEIGSVEDRPVGDVIRSALRVLTR